MTFGSPQRFSGPSEALNDLIFLEKFIIRETYHPIMFFTDFYVT